MNSLGLFVYRVFSFFIPETRGFAFKRSMLRLCGGEIGENVRICSSAFILGAGKLRIGDDTWVGHQCIISSSSMIDIGDNVDLAPRVYIGTGTHEIDVDGRHIAGKGINKDITIGNGCWICASSTILPGVVIGKKSIIAAGAVVTKSISDNLLVGGIPAVILKQIK